MLVITLSVPNDLVNAYDSDLVNARDSKFVDTYTNDLVNFIMIIMCNKNKKEETYTSKTRTRQR